MKTDRPVDDQLAPRTDPDDVTADDRLGRDLELVPVADDPDGVAAQHLQVVELPLRADLLH